MSLFDLTRTGPGPRVLVFAPPVFCFCRQITGAGLLIPSNSAELAYSSFQREQIEGNFRGSTYMESCVFVQFRKSMRVVHFSH